MPSDTVLRPYQVEDEECIWNSIIEGIRRPLVKCATGTGKTTTMAAFVKRVLENGGRVVVNVDRREIVLDIYNRIRLDCNLYIGFGMAEIGVEMADMHAPETCKVVVCSIQSMTEERAKALLSWLKPTHLITDECETSCAPTNLRFIEMCGVNRGECAHVGFTATPERGDGKALFAYNIDGTPFTLMKGKQKRMVVARPEDCVYDRVIIDRDFIWGVDEGWLVDGVFHGVETGEDISDIPLKTDGEFDQDKLAERINNAKRTLPVIAAWKDHAADRQTVVFCASVQHAHDSAELWTQAGVNAVAIDGTTPKEERERIFRKFKTGEIRVLTNFKVVEKGIDVPACSCIVFLKPSRSRRYIIQAVGRGLRVLPGLVDTDELRTAEPELRRAAIAGSAKRDCIILDAVDISAVDIRRAQELVGLPSNMVMNGESLRETKKKVDDFCKKTGRDLSQCPLEYKEVEYILKRHVALAQSKVKHKHEWEATANGYKFTKTRPGYKAEFNHDTRTLTVVGPQNEPVWSSPVKDQFVNADLAKFLESARGKIYEKITDHVQANPTFKGTTTKATPKQIDALCRFYQREGVTRAVIDRWPEYELKNRLNRMFNKWGESRKKVTA